MCQQRCQERTKLDLPRVGIILKIVESWEKTFNNGSCILIPVQEYRLLSRILSHDDFNGISPEKKSPSTTVGLLFQESWVLKRRNNDFLKLLFDVFCPSTCLPFPRRNASRLYKWFTFIIVIVVLPASFFIIIPVPSDHIIHCVPSHAKAHRQSISSPINMFPSSDRSCPT